MASKKYHISFLLILIIAAGILVFFIFQPFLTAILTAAILAVVFRKPYGFFLRISRHRKTIASFFTCILIAVTIIIPASLTLGLMAREANQIYKNVTAENSMYKERIDKIMVYAKDLPFVQSFEMDNILAQEGILNALKNISQWLIVLVRKTYKNVVGLVLGIFIMFFSLFYFFIEGEKLVQKILYLSPLKSSQEELLLNKFVSISRATIKGALTVAVIQGLIGGFAFFITGVPATAIWTMLMIILSMIPLLGSGFVWFPVGIWMLIAGRIWQGIVILAVGFGIISTIDNLLRPKLVGQDIQMHPLLVFFTTLGGIVAFGIVGFILGPIIMAFFLTLLEIYAQEFKQHLEAMNKI